ncbi:hypothetical protein SH601_11430 [Gracilibacillus sp. S3-1-1]|uniref:Uncharacterized protein n=1 Tax=Gracilibacillus pellucidus TaxID=3095368 RepID=A0ACC6M6P4_9BACI|nr:hypothetical protein [Gracilibacillus sp. S3-1-1]MDX8046595.1 hypothetical protein [Gracilibacillus sp. S3-1-1]
MNKGLVLNLQRMLFTDYFNLWLETYKTTIKGNTLERYYTTSNTIEEEFEGIYIQDITKTLLSEVFKRI